MLNNTLFPVSTPVEKKVEKHVATNVEKNAAKNVAEPVTRPTTKPISTTASASGGTRGAAAAPRPALVSPNASVEAALRAVARIASHAGARVAADDEPTSDIDDDSVDSDSDADDESADRTPSAWLRMTAVAAPPGSPPLPPTSPPDGSNRDGNNRGGNDRRGNNRGGDEPSRAKPRDAKAVRHALVRPDDRHRSWSDWLADPYQGCGFDCVSCMARRARTTNSTTAAATSRSTSHSAAAEAGGHADEARGGPEPARPTQHPLYVMSCFPESLRRDLADRVKAGEHIAFGSVTDPYQRAERHECLTRASLRELTRVAGLRISITTKSTMVTRDLDLLVQVAARNAVQINLAMTTTDARLARVLEPHLPTPSGSLAALREIRAAGLRAGVFVMPVLPGITDAESDLRALIVAARDAGAQFVAHRTAFLDGSARSHFLAVLRRAYPRVAARHELWTRCGPTLPNEVRHQIATRIQSIARTCGLPAASGEQPPAPSVETQRRFEFAS